MIIVKIFIQKPIYALTETNRTPFTPNEIESNTVADTTLSILLGIVYICNT